MRFNTIINILFIITFDLKIHTNRYNLIKNNHNTTLFIALNLFHAMCFNYSSQKPYKILFTSFGKKKLCTINNVIHIVSITKSIFF